MSVRHSIIVQVYNHEEFFTRCIESVLCQSVLPFEIIIGDDFSSDRSVEIISAYKDKFPDIIRFFPQSTNLGIYQHLNFLTTKVCGDVVSILSGDDFLTGNMLEKFDRVILDENLNPESDKFIIAANHWILQKNGDMTIFDNTSIVFRDLFKERLRYGLSFRDCGMSKALVKSLDPVNLNVGILSDWLWGFDQIVKCEKFITLPDAYYVYRQGVGIISRTARTQLAISGQKVLQIVQEQYADRIDKKDMLYIEYLRSKFSFEINSNFSRHISLLFWTLANFWNFSRNNPLRSNLRAFTVLVPPTFRKFLKSQFSKKSTDQR